MGASLQDLLKERIFDHIRLDDIIPLIALRIDGVEVTQAIQYYKADAHLTDPADRGPDNSVRLAAGKPAWIRVYVRGGLFNVADVTGTVHVYRRIGGFFWSKIAELGPEPPGSVTAPTTADYAAERGSTASTLNFVVPADKMMCNMRFRIEVTSPAGYSSTRTIDIDATLQQTLSMRIVPVSYNGPDSAGTGTLNLPAPTLAEAQATAAWSLLVYPVRSLPNISLASSVQLTFPLTGAPATAGGCAQSWINLNVLIAQAKTADGNLPNTFYYGLVPSQVPIGANSGCASSGVTSGRVNGQTTMAHEFGHALGYPHAPCGVGGDPTYPAYEPYDAGGVPGASIGEYGLDISTGIVRSPAATKDYMSYCGPRWISLYNYQRALNHSMLSPVICSDDPWWWDDIIIDELPPFRWPIPLPDPPPWYKDRIQPMDPLEPLISIIGVYQLTGEFEVRSITRTMASPQLLGGRPTGIRAELLGENGKVLSVASVFRLTGQGAGCCGGADREGDSVPWVFQALIPDKERGTALCLHNEDRELWRKEAPESRPSAADVSARVDKRGKVHVTWKLPRGEQDNEVWIRAQANRRQTPQILHVAHGSGKVELGADRLPPGKVKLDALVQNGFDCVTSKPVTIDVPDRPPSVAILHPFQDRTVIADRTLRLHGMATSADGTPVDPQQCFWRVGRKEVARGLDAYVQAPSTGDHDVTLVAKDDGGSSEQTVRIHCVSAQDSAE